MMDERQRLIEMLREEIAAMRAKLILLRAEHRLDLRRADREGFARERARRESA